MTRLEVEFQRSAHPHNALALASHIELSGGPDRPQATGGELHLIRPWSISDDDLAVISYAYSTEEVVDS